jgi:hypothetical protein
MPEQIEASETTLKNLFSEDFIFNIPVYQRPLAWTSEQFDDLLEDISDAMKVELDEYFMGSVLLQQQDKRKNFYDIVDGQQRITAVAILLAVIRDNTSNPDLRSKIERYIYQEEDKWKGLPAVMRIAPWEELKDIFRDYVYQMDGTKRFLQDFGSKVQYKDHEDPRYHLYEAISTFNEGTSARDAESVENLVKYLLNNVYVVCIKTGTQASAFRLFNVLNSRGLPLDPSDLLKSENLGSIQEASKREIYADIWRGIEEDLGREELSDLIAFIRTIKMKEKAQLSIYDEFLQIFGKGLLSRGTAFIDYVKEIADIYRNRVLEGKLDSRDPRENNDFRITIDLMRRFVPFSDWIPPLLAFDHKFKADGDLLKFTSRLEKKVVVEWAIGFSPRQRITSLNKIIKVVEEANRPGEVVDKMEMPRIEDSETALKNKLNDSQLYTLYGGKLAKYLLLRIDKECWELENFPGYPGTVTVEHILPQDPPQDSRWATLFNKEHRQEWTNKLGNLVLLSGRKNSKARNYGFDEKKKAYFGEKGTAFRITQRLESYADWNLENLKARHENLVGQARDLLLS